MAAAILGVVVLLVGALVTAEVPLVDEPVAPATKKLAGKIKSFKNKNFHFRATFERTEPACHLDPITKFPKYCDFFEQD